MNKAIVIIGPTSSGKTLLALQIAKKINGVIVSADSRQIYKFMDIGTGKTPINSSLEIKKLNDKWQIDGIDVYMYDLVFPNEAFSVSTYVEKAKQIINRIIENNQTPIIVGGTGFYIDILTSSQKIFQVKPDLKLRTELYALSLKEIQDKFIQLKSDKFENIDMNNPVRLVRAIEIILSGKNDENIGLENFEYLKIALTADREYLFLRVDNWVDAILEDLIVEVKDLIDRGYKNSEALQGVIYKNVYSYLIGEIILKDDLKNKIKFELHGYIRRQQTYFKRIQDVTWYNIVDNTFDQVVLKQVESFYNVKNSNQINRQIK